MGRGVNANSILYGNSGPRQLTHEATIAQQLAAELSPRSQAILKSLYRVSQQSVGQKLRSRWTAQNLQRDLRSAEEQPLSVNSIASVLSHLEKKGFVRSFQAAVAPRVQWEISETGSQVAETL